MLIYLGLTQFCLFILNVTKNWPLLLKILFPECLHCGYKIDGGGWTLVRHAPGGSSTWHTSNDNLAGTDEYGDSATGPMSRSAWTIPFESAVTGYDEFLFSSADCGLWLIAKKTEVIGSYDGTASKYVLTTFVDM